MNFFGKSIRQHLKYQVILPEKRREEGSHLQEETRGGDQHRPGVPAEKDPEVTLPKDQRGAEREKDQEETKEPAVMKISNQDPNVRQGIHQRGRQCLCHPALQTILREARHDLQMETLISD